MGKYNMSEIKMSVLKVVDGEIEIIKYCDHRECEVDPEQSITFQGDEIHVLYQIISNPNFGGYHFEDYDRLIKEWSNIKNELEDKITCKTRGEDERSEV